MNIAPLVSSDGKNPSTPIEFLYPMKMCSSCQCDDPVKPCSMQEFRKLYTGENYVSNYVEETILTLDSIVFVYQPNNPGLRHASQATILGYAKNYPSIVIFENLSNQFQAGLFNRLDVIYGTYMWTNPGTGITRPRKWWAYYTTVNNAINIRQLCGTPVEKDFSLYTYLVLTSFEDICLFTFAYWVQQAAMVREKVLDGSIPVRCFSD